MKLGTISVNWSKLGVNLSRAAYLGTHLIGSPLPPNSNTFPLYEPEGHWATWDNAPTYVANMTLPIFDVEFYGGDPTGETSSTEAIRAALDACEAAEGGTVYLGPGIWTFHAEEGEGASIPLHFGNLVVEGAGPDQTILNFYAVDGQDPAGLVVHRGHGFTTEGTPVPIDGITLRGFRATGNAPPNEHGGKWTGTNPSSGLPWSTVGWDIYGKGLAIFGTAINTITNFVVEDTEWDNWRGETLYSGGGLELGVMVVRRSIVRQANASAISMGGQITIEDCDIYDNLNATECMCLGTPTYMVVRNCTIDGSRNLDITGDFGVFGVVYHGFRSSYLTVEDCAFGETVSAAIFLAEFASNVTIQNNTFTDTVGIYSLYLNQYAGISDAIPLVEHNKWETWLIDGNTFTAARKNVSAAIYTVTTGEDFTITNNTVVSTGSFKYGLFLQNVRPSGTFLVDGNVIDESNPSSDTTDPPAPRPTWTNNTVTGEFELGSTFINYDGPSVTTPWEVRPVWPRLNVFQLGEAQMQREIAIDDLALPQYPTGFPLEIRYEGPGNTLFGVEVQPDPGWNSLVRGYVIYDTAVVALTMNASDRFDLASYTAPGTDVRTLTEAASPYGRPANNIAFYGQLSVNLSPTVAHSFLTYSGVGIGATVTINHNANVTITHTAGVIEMSTGADFVASGSGSLSAYRHQDGTLLVGTHTVTEDAPLIGVVTSGVPGAGVHDLEVTIVQDGAHPSAGSGYYSLQRKQTGAWSEIVQIGKGDFTGTRKTYVYLDEDLGRAETYSYRCRAVSPGTPDVVSRWSNTDTETTLDDVTAPEAPYAVSATSSVLSASFREAGGTAYWFVSLLATAPADITSAADPDAEAWYSSTPTLGANTQAVSGLASGTYYLHAAQKDFYNLSAPTTSVAFVVP